MGTHIVYVYFHYVVPCTGLKMILFHHKSNLKVRQGYPCLDARVGKLKKREKKRALPMFAQKSEKLFR